MKTKALNELAGLGTQIAFEYEGFGWEHISDMMATYEDGSPGFDGDDLMHASNLAKQAKDQGMGYEEAKKYVKKNLAKNQKSGL